MVFGLFRFLQLLSWEKLLRDIQSRLLLHLVLLKKQRHLQICLSHQRFFQHRRKFLAAFLRAAQYPQTRFLAQIVFLGRFHLQNLRQARCDGDAGGLPSIARREFATQRSIVHPRRGSIPMSASLLQALQYRGLPVRRRGSFLRGRRQSLSLCYWRRHRGRFPRPCILGILLHRFPSFL